MNLHEYQGKELLKKYGVTVPEGVVVEKEEDLDAAYDQLRTDTGTEFVVVKAQSHAGGRGKGGGVKLAQNKEEMQEGASGILGMMLKTRQPPGGRAGDGRMV